MKNYLKLTLSFLLFIALFTSCEEDVSFIENNDQSKYKTVSINDAQHFLASRQNGLVLTKSNDIKLSYDVEVFDYELINNSNELLVVVPATTKYENVYSRILLLSVEGSLKSVLFNMISDENADTEFFSGKILITNLEGKFRGAFKIENGIIVSQYVKKESQKNSSYTKNDDIEEWWTDTNDLEEVIVVADLFEREGFSFSGDFWGEDNINVGSTGGDSSSESWDFGSGGTEGNSSSENDSSTWTTSTVLFTTISDPVIRNITAYLECFDLTKSAIVTLYADQPTANSSDTWAMTITGPDVGHTFVSITQNGITRTLGYYPTPGTIRPVGAPGYPPVNSSASLIRNNEGHAFDVSASTTISSSQLSNLINGIINYSSTYDLNTNNCTDFGITLANGIGMGVSDTSGNWPGGGGGSNPGNLGQDIRSLNHNTNGIIINNSGGNAPSNSGSCS